MLDHHPGGIILADHHQRRVSTPFRSNSISFRSQLSSPQLIIGKAFGPFTRCASLHSHQAQSPQPQQLFTITRHKSIGEDLISVPKPSEEVKGQQQENDTEKNEEEDKESNKLRLMTSTATQPSIDYVDDDDPVKEPRGTGTTPIIISDENVAKTEEINFNSRNRSQVSVGGGVTNQQQQSQRPTKVKTPAAVTNRQAEYKFLRRQFSMDQCRGGGGFHISPAIAAIVGARRRGGTRVDHAVDAFHRIGGGAELKVQPSIKENIKEEEEEQLKSGDKDNAEQSERKTPTGSGNNSCVKDDSPAVVGTRHTDRNRINLNIVLNGKDEPETESIDGISNPSEVDKPRQMRNGLPPTSNSRKINDIKFNRSRVTDQILDSHQKRPPLVRAMSAPIGQGLNNNSSRGYNNTRKVPPPSRRTNRRILPGGKGDEFSTTNLRQTFTSVQIRDHDDNEEDYGQEERSVVNSNKFNGSESTTRRASSAKSKNNQRTTTTTFTCDQIVTLVSLLDSGGSDDEESGEVNNKRGSERDTEGSGEAVEKAPTLRKSGKSVSFQEQANQNYPAAKEFSAIFRRGSVAPLAARIRAHRPPTAPPGSIFINSETSDSSSAYKMARRPSVAKVEPPTRTPATAAASRGEDGNKSGNGGQDQTTGGQSAKERECWKLFQKMTTRGITVSYETILRGMLTPTELRLIQKQRELEQAQLEAAAAAESATTTGSGK